MPRAHLLDSLGSSEAMGIAVSVAAHTGDGSATARFTASSETVLIDEVGNRIEPGSSAIGRLAVRGRIPLGYYNDSEKSAATFVILDGERWSIPGDQATIDANGTITLLGRGSNCINTGGEKVFPEEIEEILKEHGDIRDAAVVGLPDQRFGEVVVALIETYEDRDIMPELLRDYVCRSVASYKAPRHVVQVNSLERAPNGKLDYRRLGELAASRVERSIST